MAENYQKEQALKERLKGSTYTHSFMKMTMEGFKA